MAPKVRLTVEAEEDLFDIWRFVAENDSPAKANTLLDNLETSCHSLGQTPNKGHVPKELRRVDIFDFYEIHYKPYRILYELNEKRVLIHAVLDGRRDMESLLRSRLLR
ncbi:MAG: toxin ParE1/3/4 [Candidatus Pelagisphaera sp.]|jgi:toxin ParE1/3/4